jgi:lipid-A-disaccharide synthase-like uncharacterized protein
MRDIDRRMCFEFDWWGIAGFADSFCFSVRFSFQWFSFNNNHGRFRRQRLWEEMYNSILPGFDDWDCSFGLSFPLDIVICFIIK